MKSVSEQRFKNYEYIIIDGKSTDGTYELEKKLLNSFDNFYILSEIDNGIYDAMNKGIKYSHGEYLFFLNMGDTLYNSTVLEQCYNNIVKTHSDIVYGDVYTERRGLEKQPKNVSTLFFILEHTICHQSIFANRKVFKKNMFDSSYKICADRKWLYDCYKQKIKFHHMNVCVSKYDETGLSQNKAILGTESKRLVREEFGSLGCVLVDVKRTLGRVFRRCMHFFSMNPEYNH